MPCLLFAYRVVPQAFTGFSSFEMLFVGRLVRGPLDLLEESWTVQKNSSESVVPYILSVKEKCEKLTELV